MPLLNHIFHRTPKSTPSQKTYPLPPTSGAPTFASTLNSLFMRSTMISRWSSPIPSITVCPVSMSRENRKDGSSAASLAKAVDIFSWSALVLGSTATCTRAHNYRFRFSVLVFLYFLLLFFPLFFSMIPLPPTKKYQPNNNLSKFRIYHGKVLF